MHALFDFDEVAVVVDDQRVLDGVTVTIPERLLVVLVGASGSGKSTLLRQCNRLEVPTSGVIRFRGHDLADLDVLRHRRRVGMVFQRPTLFPGSISDNLRVADPSLSDERVAALLERVHLEASIATQDATTVSGGEAQRVCLARSLATEPDVILVDEATSALGAEHRRGIENLARELVRAGTSVLWVTHDTDQVRRLADYVVVVDRGRVLAAGTHQEVSASDDPAVRSAVGAS